MDDWISINFEQSLMIVVSTVFTYAAILCFTRIVGLRSFSKMSAVDFAMTVAVGSTFASTVTAPSPTLLVGITSLATLYAGQWFFAWARRKSDWVSSNVDNQPLLLMARGTMLHHNLREANVTENDVYGKLRESNALNYDQVLAVVFETTGDISVMHSSDSDVAIERDFLRDVKDADKIFENEFQASST